MYKRIGIIVAMDKEFSQLERLLTDKQELKGGRCPITVGTMGSLQVALEKCGIGKVNSTIGAMELIRLFAPDAIISSGCAGGADVSLHVGDVVVAQQCAYHDAYCGSECQPGQILGMPARFDAPKDLLNAALQLDGADGTTVRGGLTVSGEWFVDSRDKMQAILNVFPDAMAVDMESCSIAQTCHVCKVLFLSFRVISDIPLLDHKAEMYFDFWDRMADSSFHVTRHLLKVIAEL